MFRRLISAAGQSRSAKTLEVLGWLILFEGTIVLFAPHFAVSVLGISLALFFNSRLRQFSLDTVQLACRTAKIVEENFYE